MREILFRGKRQDNGEWVYGSFIPDLLEVYATDEQKGLTDWGFIKPFGKTKEERMMQYVERGSVGQYTGLTDKNGVKIFEGDIVHYVYAPGYEFWKADQLSVIVWDSTGFKLDGIEGTNKYALMQGWMVSIPQPKSAFEVIGNVHDRPELLKGGARP